MGDGTDSGRGDGGASETGREEADDAATSWSRRVSQLRPDESARSDSGDGTGPATAGGRDLTPGPAPGARDGLLEEGLERLRRDARRAAREDAEHGRPPPDDETTPESEASLRERCRSLFERWTRAERRRIRELLAEQEELASKLLGRTELLLGRFERLTSELIRLKARRSSDRRERETESEAEGRNHEAGLSTKVYLSAIGFLGLVEFFANAPVFSALLPRDPLTEQQINVIMETSTGWMAGVERVLAQLVLRPDAALLAAGVVTFLCVLAHFFGHSLRELVMKKDGRSRRGAATSRSAMENVVPMVLTGIGLALVLGVLFQARVILGDVGERRYQDDMDAVAELRREAGWLRSDGDLLEANQLADRADDMEEAATRLREYAASMSRMTFPILLLNLTLVLAAITAAYFHRRDGSGDHFGDLAYEDDRQEITEAAEATASEISDVLSRARRSIRELKHLAEDGFSQAPGSVCRRLESVLQLYRRENARNRDLAPGNVAAFRGPVELGLEPDGKETDLSSFRQAARDAEAEHRELSRRFKEARSRFNEHLQSWETDALDA